MTINVITYLFVKISCREVCLEPVFWILIGIIVCEATLLLHLVILVVSSINNDRRMVADAFDLRNTFGFDGFPVLLDGSRVVTTTKHEVLPDEDAELVAGIVEDVLFPDTTAPNSVNDG